MFAVDSGREGGPAVEGAGLVHAYGLGNGIGHQVLFATFTIGHSFDDLPDKLMNALGHARSALTSGGSGNGGSRSLGDRRRFGVCGMVSTVKVTWNCNSGYHFHLHCLLLLQHP